MIFETKRLFIRKLTENDLEPFAQLHSNERAMSMVPTKVLNKEESHKMLLDLIEKEKLKQFNAWAILNKSNHFIGVGGLMRNEKGTEIGYRFLEEYWGKGYATELCEGLIAFAIKNDWTDLHADVTCTNNGSIAVLSKFMNKHGESFNEEDQAMEFHFRLK